MTSDGSLLFDVVSESMSDTTLSWHSKDESYVTFSVSGSTVTSMVVRVGVDSVLHISGVDI